MSHGLTVEVHPIINPISSQDWKESFPHEIDPHKVCLMPGKVLENQFSYASIVVKHNERPILLVPLLVMKAQAIGVWQSLFIDCARVLNQIARIASDWFSSLLFGQRVDRDYFGESYVFSAVDVVPGSALNEQALEEAFHVFEALSATMPVVLVNRQETALGAIKRAAAESLV